MNKELPKSVSILGQNYNVVRKLPKGHDMQDQVDQLHGLFDHAKKLIFVSPSISGEEAWRTLWHEIVHAVQYRSALTFVMDATMMEIAAETTSSAIYEVIQELRMK